MNLARSIDLINDLRKRPTETACLEFKKDNADSNMIAKSCSALANAAAYEGDDCAYMIWGIEDGSHKIVGTKFNPDSRKFRGQLFKLWLTQHLKPDVGFEFEVVEHPQGRLVMLKIPAATSAPVVFNNVPYIRIGAATSNLMKYPDRYQQLIERIRPYRWEQGVAQEYVTSDDVLHLIDYPAYFRLMKQQLPDNRAGILERLAADGIITEDVGGKWNITNIGAIMFAVNLEKFGTSLARKAVRLTVYNGKNKVAAVTHRRDGVKGYAVGFENLVNYINDLSPKNEHIGDAIRVSQSLFPPAAIRELVANALIHQDMTLTGTGPQIEIFQDRVEITNPGKSLVQTERMIDLPPRSRNEELAALMRRMEMCEEQGTGLDRVIHQVEFFQLPPPLFRADEQSMQVILYGRRSFANMTAEERLRACYHHAALKWLSGERMKNAGLCQRFGIQSKNAAQVSVVIKKALGEGLIKVADPEHSRAGYVPSWA